MIHASAVLSLINGPEAVKTAVLVSDTVYFASSLSALKNGLWSHYCTKHPTCELPCFCQLIIIHNNMHSLCRVMKSYIFLLSELVSHMEPINGPIRELLLSHFETYTTCFLVKSWFEQEEWNDASVISFVCNKLTKRQMCTLNRGTWEPNWPLTSKEVVSSHARHQSSLYRLLWLVFDKTCHDVVQEMISVWKSELPCCNFWWNTASNISSPFFVLSRQRWPRG